LQGIIAAGTLLVVASTCVFPGWLLAMLDAPRQTPMVIVDRPWLATSWWALLRTLGVTGVPLLVLYLALAGLVLGLVLRTAWDRRTSALRLMALSTLASLAIVPYVRYYDLPILLLPLVELLGRPLLGSARGLLAAAFMVVPLALWLMIAGEPSVFVGQLQCLWMVASLVGTWAWSEWQSRATDRRSKPATSQALHAG
jgi:hypothetical protein